MNRTHYAILAVAALTATLFAAPPASAYTAKHAPSWYLCRMVALDDDQYNVAVDACTAVIQASAGDREELHHALKTRAGFYCKLGQYVLAVADYEQLVRQDGSYRPHLSQDADGDAKQLQGAKYAVSGRPNTECEKEGT